MNKKDNAMQITSVSIIILMVLGILLVGNLTSPNLPYLFGGFILIFLATMVHMKNQGWW